MEDLEAIRGRMQQEYFDAEEYEFNFIQKLLCCGATLSFGLGAWTSSYMLLTTSKWTNLAICAGVLSIGTVIKCLYQTVKNTIKLRKSKKTKPNLEKHDIWTDELSKSRWAEKKVNILFNKNKGSKSISSTLRAQTIFFPSDLDELEYTVLTQISESEANWANLPDYHNWMQETNHARRKRRTQKVKKESQTDKQTLSKNNEPFMKPYIDFKRSRSNFGYEEVPNEEKRFTRVLKK